MMRKPCVTIKYVKSIFSHMFLKFLDNLFLFFIDKTNEGKSIKNCHYYCFVSSIRKVLEVDNIMNSSKHTKVNFSLGEFKSNFFIKSTLFSRVKNYITLTIICSVTEQVFHGHKI